MCWWAQFRANGLSDRIVVTASFWRVLLGRRSSLMMDHPCFHGRVIRLILSLPLFSTVYLLHRPSIGCCT
ncbi:hypothetical protein RISK_002221 [Rhodopirellula islandica]|uniref:Uncharacterized protein n=1 Tax=Rhodopirellula islandica TaxID=595434 RepID=A0A0J1EJ81_RHOIS|nr:hypothetical protein RISK_002221 [Rhodopirellula islandica]